MTDAPERIWTCTHVGEYGYYFPEAVEAEGKYGGMAVEYVRADLEATASPRVKALAEAAQAVVDRWDSPQWKDLRHTGTHINKLRDAISELEKNK